MEYSGDCNHTMLQRKMTTDIRTQANDRHFAAIIEEPIISLAHMTTEKHNENEILLLLLLLRSQLYLWGSPLFMGFFRTWQFFLIQPQR